MKIKNGLCISLFVLSLLIFTGCGWQPANDINSTENSANNDRKTIVHMMYMGKLNHFEKLVEDTYSDIDLKCEQSTIGTINGDSERRIKNGHGLDLVITTMPMGDVKDYMLDMSAEDYADNYQVTMTASIMVEGQTRYLPLPGQFSGYVINKTLAEQIGNASPKNNQDLLELFDEGKKKNLGIGKDGVMFDLYRVDAGSIGTYVMSLQVPDFLGQVSGIEWLSELDEKKTSFSGSWEHCLDMLSEWKERGYLNPQTWSLMTSGYNAMPTLQRMKDGEMLLAYGNVELLNKLNDAKNGYEYTMLPILSDQENDGWVISFPDTYIGINAALDKEGESQKLDACKRILALLSSKEGQDAWMEDTGATDSYLIGYQAKTDNFPPGLEQSIQNRYIYNLQMPSNIVRYFGTEMAAAINGSISIQEALALVDDYYIHGSKKVDYDQSIVGIAAEDFLYENYNTRKMETAIGNLVADAVREFSHSQIAVVNGGGIRASLYQGDILGADLNAVCPYSNLITVVEAKGSTIIEMLKNSVSKINVDDVPGGRFLQVSGLHYSYRIKEKNVPCELVSATLADGTPIEEDTVYTLAINNYMAGVNGYENNNGDEYQMLNLYSSDVPKGEVKLVEEMNATYADALKAYLSSRQNEKITAVLEGRITIVE